MADDESTKKLHIFGEDVSEIPCFRSSFLTGIPSGFAVGVAFFLFTSKLRQATHLGYFAFFGTTLCYWIYCRYDWSSKRFLYRQVQAKMKTITLLEGTDKDLNVTKPETKS